MNANNKIYCIFKNDCGSSICCNQCKKTGCKVRCTDNVTKCKYTADIPDYMNTLALRNNPFVKNDYDAKRNNDKTAMDTTKTLPETLSSYKNIIKSFYTDENGERLGKRKGSFTYWVELIPGHVFADGTTKTNVRNIQECAYYLRHVKVVD